MESSEPRSCAEDPWVVWAENNGTGPPAFARMSEFSGFYMMDQDLPKHKIVDGAFDDLFQLLDNECKNENSIFQMNGAAYPMFNWLRPMWQTAAAVVFYQAISDKDVITPTEICYMMSRTCLKRFEEAWNRERRLGANRQKTWHRSFGNLLRDHWYSRLNSMSYSDSVLVSHALMLHLIQDFTEVSEREKGQVHQPTMAEAFAMKLARRKPTLYANHVYPLFQAGVYGRTTLILPIVPAEEGS